ncbi:hypothetical protein SD398_05350 [Bacteroides fragilis]|uniref:Uncharacterized protein n=1 Tax=Bacteroides fragilis TaxID=817 RepID=A0A9X9NFI1_BACFG|nr:hypothetical protein [Bacteroides fragilis]MCS3113303.1 hypothetical protein [Bacteroides fragilis]UVO89430.1 hypothetical protein NXW39_19090 [Bacteroides fragilis]UVQ50936.1 hypothetical protein NXY12_18305 [Bacteroides fragilis]
MNVTSGKGDAVIALATQHRNFGYAAPQLWLRSTVTLATQHRNFGYAAP